MEGFVSLSGWQQNKSYITFSYRLNLVMNDLDLCNIFILLMNPYQLFVSNHSFSLFKPDFFSPYLERDTFSLWCLFLLSNVLDSYRLTIFSVLATYLCDKVNNSLWQRYKIRFWLKHNRKLEKTGSFIAFLLWNEIMEFSHR